MSWPPPRPPPGIPPPCLVPCPWMPPARPGASYGLRAPGAVCRTMGRSWCLIARRCCVPARSRPSVGVLHPAAAPMRPEPPPVPLGEPACPSSGPSPAAPQPSSGGFRDPRRPDVTQSAHDWSGGLGIARTLRTMGRWRICSFERVRSMASSLRYDSYGFETGSSTPLNSWSCRERHRRS